MDPMETSSTNFVGGFWLDFLLPVREGTISGCPYVKIRFVLMLSWRFQIHEIIYWKVEIAKKYSEKESPGSINGDIRSAKYKVTNCDIFFMPLRIIGPSKVLNLYVYDASGCFFFGPQNDASFEVSRYMGVVSILFHKTWILGLESQAAPRQCWSLFLSEPDPGTPQKAPEALSRWKVCLWARFTVSEECQMPRKLFFIALPCLLPKQTTSWCMHKWGLWKKPGWLGYIGESTPQIWGHFNEPF